MLSELADDLTPQPQSKLENTKLDKDATIDPTATNAPPFRSLKSPVSSPPEQSTSSSTRRRKTIPHGKVSVERHSEPTGTGHLFLPSHICLSLTDLDDSPCAHG